MTETLKRPFVIVTYAGIDYVTFHCVGLVLAVVHSSDFDEPQLAEFYDLQMCLAAEHGVKVPGKSPLSVRENIQNFEFHEFVSAAVFTPV